MKNPLPTLHLGYDGHEARVRRILFFNEEKASPYAYTETLQKEVFIAEPYFEDPPDEELSSGTSFFPWPLILVLTVMFLMQKLQEMHSHLSSLIAENLRLKAELAKMKNVKYVDSLLQSDADINFFTGLPSKVVFLKLHKLIAPLVNRRWQGVKSTGSFIRKFAKEPCRFGPQRKLSSKAEFLMTLMRLRLGLLAKDLARRFDISESLCGRIFLTWLRASAKVFSSMIFIPDEETLIATKPKKFNDIKDLHSIIDCTEIFIETPKDLELQSSTWSDYKHHNTIKLLVACSPNSSVTYISPVYTGRISDKALTLDCGYLDRIPPYSVIMADKGFNISDECAARNLILYVPPGRRGRSQMSSADVMKTKKIANSRILIEQVIRRIKTFKIIQNELPVSLIPHADEVLQVVGGICNTKGPIYK